MRWHVKYDAAKELRRSVIPVFPQEPAVTAHRGGLEWERFSIREPRFAPFARAMNQPLSGLGVALGADGDADFGRL